MGDLDGVRVLESTGDFPSLPRRRRGWRGAEAQRNLALVAGDDLMVRRALVAMLEEWGWSVLVAHNGLVALEMALDRRPEAVFLDDRIAWLSGVQVCQQLRWRRLPLWTVLLTATSDGEARAQEAGAALHLKKPLRGLDVIAALQNIMGAPAGNPMNVILSRTEFADIAKQVEACGEAFYAEAVRASPHAPVRRLFEQLADEERGHAAVIERMLGPVRRMDGVWRSAEGYLTCMRALAEGQVFPDVAAARAAVGKVRDEADALRMALVFERQSLLLLLELRPQVPERVRPLADQLIGEEQRHAARVEALLAALAGRAQDSGAPAGDRSPLGGDDEAAPTGKSAPA